MNWPPAAPAAPSATAALDATVAPPLSWQVLRPRLGCKRSSDLNVNGGHCEEQTMYTVNPAHSRAVVGRRSVPCVHTTLRYELVPHLLGPSPACVACCRVHDALWVRVNAWANERRDETVIFAFLSAISAEWLGDATSSILAVLRTSVGMCCANVYGRVTVGTYDVSCWISL